MKKSKENSGNNFGRLCHDICEQFFCVYCMLQYIQFSITLLSSNFVIL